METGVFRRKCAAPTIFVSAAHISGTADIGDLHFAILALEVGRAEAEAFVTASDADTFARQYFGSVVIGRIRSCNALIHICGHRYGHA